MGIEVGKERESEKKRKEKKARILNPHHGIILTPLNLATTDPCGENSVGEPNQSPAVHNDLELPV